MDAYTLQRAISDALNENLPAPIGDAMCLTKRELFAAMAMHGMLACGSMFFDQEMSSDQESRIAGFAVAQADALLAALDQPPPPTED